MLTLGICSALGVAAIAQAAEVPADVKLAAKQELVRNNGSEVSSLDPHKIEGVPENNVTNDLLEGLTQHDSQGQTIPGVAQRWESKDNKVWVFYLRPDAKWSNGDPVTAEDFVYSWQRMADPKTASPTRAICSMPTSRISMTSSPANRINPPWESRRWTIARSR